MFKNPKPWMRSECVHGFFGMTETLQEDANAAEQKMGFSGDQRRIPDAVCPECVH